MLNKAGLKIGTRTKLCLLHMCYFSLLRHTTMRDILKVLHHVCTVTLCGESGGYVLCFNASYIYMEAFICFNSSTATLFHPLLPYFITEIVNRCVKAVSFLTSSSFHHLLQISSNIRSTWDTIASLDWSPDSQRWHDEHRYFLVRHLSCTFCFIFTQRIKQHHNAALYPDDKTLFLEVQIIPLVVFFKTAGRCMTSYYVWRGIDVSLFTQRLKFKRH